MIGITQSPAFHRETTKLGVEFQTPQLIVRDTPDETREGLHHSFERLQTNYGIYAALAAPRRVPPLAMFASLPTVQTNCATFALNAILGDAVVDPKQWLNAFRGPGGPPDIVDDLLIRHFDFVTEFTMYLKRPQSPAKTRRLQEGDLIVLGQAGVSRGFYKQHLAMVIAVGERGEVQVRNKIGPMPVVENSLHDLVKVYGIAQTLDCQVYRRKNTIVE